MRKQSLTIFLFSLLCLLLMGCMGASAALADRMGVSMLRSATVVGDTLYFLTYDALYAQDHPGTEKRVMLTAESCPDLSASNMLLTTDGEQLFLLETHGRALYRLAEGKLEPVQPWLDAYQQRVEDGSDKKWHELLWRDAVIIGEKLYALADQPGSNHPAKLVAGSLDSGKLVEASLSAADWFCLARRGENQLIAYDRSLHQVMTLDASRGMQASALAATDTEAICHDLRQNVLLTLRNGEVQSWRDGKSETLGFFEYSSDHAALFFGTWNGRPLAACEDGLYLLGTQKPEHVITLYGDENGFDQAEAVAAYNASHPLAPAVYRQLPDAEMEEKLYEAVSVRDDQADFFVLRSYGVDFEKLCQRGLAAPIESEKLRQDVQSMYPQIRDWVMRDGQLYAFPIRLYMDLQIIHSEGWTAVGPGEPPATVQDYAAAAVRWYQMEREEQDGFFFALDSDLQALLRQGCLQYAISCKEENRPLTFQTPEFLSWMEQWISLQPALRKQYAMDKPEDAAYLIDSAFHMPYMQTPGTGVSERQADFPYAVEVMPLPSWDGKAQRYSPATLYMLVLNPYSKHQKEAVAFLEYLSKHLDARTLYELHPDENDMRLPPDIQQMVDSLTKDLRKWEEIAAKLEAKKAEGQLVGEEIGDLTDAKDRVYRLQKEISQYQESCWIYTPYELQRYRAVAEHMLIDQPQLPWNELGTLLDQALEGRITAAQALDQMDRKLRMIELEDR